MCFSRFGLSVKNGKIQKTKQNAKITEQKRKLKIPKASWMECDALPQRVKKSCHPWTWTWMISTFTRICKVHNYFLYQVNPHCCFCWMSCQGLHPRLQKATNTINMPRDPVCYLIFTLLSCLIFLHGSHSYLLCNLQLMCLHWTWTKPLLKVRVPHFVSAVYDSLPRAIQSCIWGLTTFLHSMWEVASFKAQKVA